MWRPWQACPSFWQAFPNRFPAGVVKVAWVVSQPLGGLVTPYIFILQLDRAKGDYDASSMEES